MVLTKNRKSYLAELLADENNYLWSQVLYGITGGDGSDRDRCTLSGWQCGRSSRIGRGTVLTPV